MADSSRLSNRSQACQIHDSPPFSCRPVPPHTMSDQEMTPIESEVLETAIEIIGEEGISDEEIEERVLALAKDAMLARRLIDWLPEILGAVAVGHMGKVNFVDTFSAKTMQGKWKSIPMKAEPIYVQGHKLAQEAWHRDWTRAHERVAFRSAIMRSAGQVLDSGQSLDGVTTSGPALIGIPAEIYRSEVPLLQRLFW